MHARLLDVFHHTPDKHLLPITQAIDINLNGVIQKAIEQHWRIIANFHGLAHVAFEVTLLMYDFHSAATQHITWAHHQGITDFLSMRQGFTFSTRSAVRRLAKIELG